MNYNFLRRACWMIASINNNLSSYLDSKFQLNDPELHEITTNAFRNGINDVQFKKIKYNWFESTRKVFDYIRNRNQDWCQHISRTIKSSELQRYLNGQTQTHDVLVIKKDNNDASLKVLEGQYMLIVRISMTQFQCLFDKTWYDCNGSQAIKTARDFQTNNGIFVYLKKGIKPLAVAKQSLPIYNNKSVLESRKNVSDNILNPLRFRSSPPESRQSDPSVIDAKFYQIKEPTESKFDWNKIPRENSTSIIEVVEKLNLNRIMSNLNGERRTVPITSSWSQREIHSAKLIETQCYMKFWSQQYKIKK